MPGGPVPGGHARNSSCTPALDSRLEKPPRPSWMSSSGDPDTQPARSCFQLELGFGGEVCAAGGLTGDTARAERSGSTALPAETAGKRRSLGEGEAAELSGSPEVLRPEAAEERGSQVLR